MKRITTKTAARLGGRAKLRVIKPDGTVRLETAWKNNLVLNDGIADQMTNGLIWRNCLGACRAGTGTTAASVALDGTFARSGTTVTRSTGTGTFSAGDVNKYIKFGSGEEALIVSHTGSTEVEVRESGAVAASSLTLYDTERTALDAQVAVTTTLDGTSGANSYTEDGLAGTFTIKRTFNFAVEVGTVNYNEVGFGRGTTSDLLSRVVLASTVTVNAGEQLQVVYELVLTADNITSAVPGALTIAGWPHEYTVTDITSTASNFDVTFDDDHHYQAGDEITISDALPVKVAITTLTSDVSEFTITTSAPHGLSVSDGIEIEGASVGGYNGAWTVAAVDSTTVFRITSAANPGAATGGTVRLATPGSWYNGTWTVASAPTTDSIRITSAINPIDAGEGTVTGNLDGELRMYGFGEGTLFGLSTFGICDSGTIDQYTASIIQEGNEATNLGPGQVGFLTGETASASRDKDNVAYDATAQTYGRTFEFDIDEGNFDDIKQFVIRGNGGSSAAAIVWTFDQNQRKDAGYSLLIGYEITFRQTLP